MISFSIHAQDKNILYGIDHLQDENIIRLLTGKNLAVLTHAAGVNHQGVHLIDILFKNFSLKKIFAPEHGLRTLEDDWIDDGVDVATGLPVISLYKSKTKSPDPKDLEGIDAIVIDLQDVGLRYYTYFSTIAEVMKVCAKLQIEVILLDRPNLLGGNILEGKTLDVHLAGNFTAYHTIPTRHGMTLGELSYMINGEKSMGVKLSVIKTFGWHREELITNHHRRWISPSPALISIEQVALYALWGTLENFNLAVGRGKTNELAFHIIGAPWISETESHELSKALNSLYLEGIYFEPFSWKVSRAIYLGEIARGVKIHISHKYCITKIRTDELTYKVATILLKMFKGRIHFSKTSPLAYGSESMVSAITYGIPWKETQKTIDSELEEFKRRRKTYLLY